MNVFLVIFLVIFSLSCANQEKIKEQIPDVIVDPQTGIRYRRHINTEHKGKKRIEIEKQTRGKTGVEKEEYWITPGYSITTLSHLPIKEIIAEGRLENFDDELLRELATRDKKGVPYLIYYLQSEKMVNLSDTSQNLKWYENKNEFEHLTQNLYAAYVLQDILNIKPQDIEFKVSRKNSILYAVKGQYAVKKNEVIKAWQQWWQQAQKKFK